MIETAEEINIVEEKEQRVTTSVADNTIQTPLHERRSFIQGMAATLKQPQEDIQEVDPFQEMMTSKASFNRFGSKKQSKTGTRKGSVFGEKTYVSKPTTSQGMRSKSNALNRDKIYGAAYSRPVNTSNQKKRRGMTPGLGNSSFGTAAMNITGQG